MFLAPLNSDRFFKKVFSDIDIAKQFLEDFLDIEIESIEILERKHKITDESSAVEFDFRCKINGQYTIVDMQQWYKTDVVKRFYVYHSLGSALQLEDLPKREFPEIDGKKLDTKIYSELMPTITLIWMAHDSLGFQEDYIAYTLCPEQAVEFLKNDVLWATQTAENLDIERKKVLSLLNNKTKNIDFLLQNRLVFAFQQNIVKNKKLKKYCDWFELAEKTRNKNNVEEDFETFKKNPTLMAVMERIEKRNWI